MPNKTKSVRTETGEQKKARSEARVLLFDVETTPLLGYAYSRRETDLIMVLEEKKIISFSWKWLGERQTHVLALPDFPGFKKDNRDNRALILKLHELISSADIVVAHNANFDDKMAASDFVTLGLPPTAPHKTICTLKVARAKFKFSSNKLDDLGQRLGLGRKVQTGGFKLWKACMDGDLKAYEKMKAYNRQDVILLEKIYLKMRPWMTNHPALKVREDTNKNPPCPQCDERKLQNRGFNISRSGRTPRLQCVACGHWPPIAWVRQAWRLK